MEIKDILSTLTTEEKIRLLSGVGSWHTYDCNGKVPTIMMTDGPHGLRKQEAEEFSDINKSEVATCFPTASAIASSWNTEAISQMAAAIAEEALKEKVSVVLGCGINIKRSPLCGRNFEYFSEDPYLAGKMASAYIKAMQKHGVGTSLKHFAANNQETRRQTSNSQIDERALREIYLTAFEMAVKEAQPTTVMASYNLLNGEHACASRRLLTDILRNEWGFQGAVISDWGAVTDIVQCIKAGMDLEMPDSQELHIEPIRNALEDGSLTMQELDQAAERVLQLVMTQAEKIQDTATDYKAHHELARELACESAVLLENDGMLPLEHADKVIVVGELACHMRFQGGGSSHITTAPTKNAIESLQAKGIEVIYVQGYHNEKDKPDDRLEQEAVEAAKQKLPILFFGGLTDEFEGEGYDRTSLKIPSCQTSLLKQILQVNQDVAFISFGGSPMDLPQAGDVRAILHMYLGGQAVGEACADLITGAVNPSGKLAETFPYAMEDIPCRRCFAPDSDDVEYRESIFVGYRYYDSYYKPCRYHFGYGLSYTTFEYSNFKLSTSRYSGGQLMASFTLTNTGSRKGSEIAQVYVVNPKENYIRPKKELREFVKVSLEAGESKTITITLNERSFSLYDTDRAEFIVPSGEYKILIGASLQDIRLDQDIEVEGVPYDRDDTERLSEYMSMGNTESPEISEKQFELLYEKELSHLDDVKKGEFTLYHSFEKLAAHSLLGSLSLAYVKHTLYKMNRGKPKDDPSVRILIDGVRENTIASLACASGGLFPPGLASAIVLSANGHHKEAIARLFDRKKKGF
ncbi:MAG: glycoside hydrolase family 3 N-terminal domain-containing protein [bacterium]|nr:glycoside hydrolase family 3 N-terminal domain-containing protein [bacterium]